MAKKRSKRTNSHGIGAKVEACVAGCRRSTIAMCAARAWDWILHAVFYISKFFRSKPVQAPIRVPATTKKSSKKTSSSMNDAPSSSTASSPLSRSNGHIRMHDRLRTTELCLNRLLPEPGLTQMVRSYYKDLVVVDAGERMTQIFYELSEMQMSDAETKLLLNEVTDYANYYVDHPLYISGLLMLLVMADFDDDKIQSELGYQTMSAIFESTRQHLDNQAGDLIVVVAQSFDDCVESERYDNCLSDWNVRYIEKLLELDIIELLFSFPENDVQLVSFGPDIDAILQDYAKILMVLSIYLASHPEHAQAEQLDRLLGAVRTVMEAEPNLS